MKTRIGSIANDKVTLRGLRSDDADSLFTLLSTPAVTQFISPPPPNVERFGNFISWTERQREAGRLLCLGIVPHDQPTAVGLIQVRPETPHASTAEWGFALSDKFWG